MRSRLLLASCLLAALPALPGQAPPAPLPPIPAPPDKAEFLARRQALARAVALSQREGHVVILVRGASKRADFGAFVQDQDFLYLTGIQEPDLALLLVPGPEGTLLVDELLVPPFSRFAATWDGTFLAPGEQTAERTGFQTAGNVRALPDRLQALLTADAAGERPVLYTPLLPAAMTGSTDSKAQGAAATIAKDPLDGRRSREAALREKLLALMPGLRIKELAGFTQRLRWQKSPVEIGLLRASAELAAEGHAEAMRSARPGLYEFQVAAVARYVFSLRGAGPDAYAAIVGAGPNGCILHYNALNKRMEDGELVVMDYAATLHGYASDVTRTFPVNGRFTAEQRKLVTDVWEIQQELLAMVKPGARLSAIGRRCSEMLRERGYRSDHGPCHHVGLAVHDPSVDVLQEGMVITVEPGAYLRDKGMGCRIEDTVLVTKDGHENLSGHLPSHPDAVEKLMAERGVLEVPVGLRRQ